MSCRMVSSGPSAWPCTERLDLFDDLAHVAAGRCARGHQLGDGVSVPRDGDALPVLDSLEQFGEMSLGFVCADADPRFTEAA